MVVVVVVLIVVVVVLVGNFLKSPSRFPLSLARLGPYEIEGPYDKCMDWCLRGDPAEYYLAPWRLGGLVSILLGVKGVSFWLQSGAQDFESRFGL